MDPKETLGYKLNNPLNLRPLDNQLWHGQTGITSGFCRFDVPQWCFRAWLIQSRNYFLSWKIETMLDFLKHYAPALDGNDPFKYANSVEDTLKIERGSSIDLAFLNTRKLDWCEAQMLVEIGGIPYSVATILEGFSWAENH